jgi:hypothetical protein
MVKHACPNSNTAVMLSSIPYARRTEGSERVQRQVSEVVPSFPFGGRALAESQQANERVAQLAGTCPARRSCWQRQRKRARGIRRRLHVLRTRVRRASIRVLSGTKETPA